MLLPRDCAEIKCSNPGAASGVYDISPGQCSGPGCQASVYCDMDHAGGGWTVWLNRFDGSLSFDETWSNYENGFGTPSGEHYLGRWGQGRSQN